MRTWKDAASAMAALVLLVAGLAFFFSKPPVQSCDVPSYRAKRPCR